MAKTTVKYKRCGTIRTTWNPWKAAKNLITLLLIVSIIPLSVIALRIGIDGELARRDAINSEFLDTMDAAIRLEKFND